MLTAPLCYQCDMAKSAQRLVVGGAALTVVIGLTSGVAASEEPKSWQPADFGLARQRKDHDHARAASRTACGSAT